MGAGKEALLQTAKSPAFGFRAHNAPLGMRFIRNATVPEEFDRVALAALHGSWNRTEPDGYKVVSLHWQDDGSIESQDFLSGFELDGDIIGRPVDIAEGPDGCLFISDDFAGTIYRVCYGVEQNTLIVNTATSEDSDWAALSDTEKSSLSEQGKALYALNNCSVCHQLQGKGNPSGKQLTELHQRYSYHSLSEYFLSPNPPMPQFNLSEQERLALSAYLLTTAP